MTSINQSDTMSAATSGKASSELSGLASRKPWSAPLVIVSVMQNSENNNNGNNSDTTTSGVPFGNS